MTSILHDYHVHTTYCDGKSSPDEIIQEALLTGMNKIGFSGHSFVSFDDSGYCMTPESTRLYFNDINSLKIKYADEIKIFCGTEQDYYSQKPDLNFDYLIGSVHYVFKDGAYIPVDGSPNGLLNNVNQYYHGDFYSFAEDYYKNVADVVNKLHPQIIGHFDLILKFNEKYNFIDENDKRYHDAAISALDELLKTNVPIEINTGAISRGWRKNPYPSMEILKRIAQKHGRVILSSDSHHKSTLRFDFDMCEKIVRGLNLELVDIF